MQPKESVGLNGTTRHLLMNCDAVSDSQERAIEVETFLDILIHLGLEFPQGREDLRAQQIIKSQFINKAFDTVGHNILLGYQTSDVMNINDFTVT